MAFAPLLAGSGVTGWTLLKRSQASQTAQWSAQPEIAREERYFRDRIGKIDRAEELVADRRLLKVALEAFGLEADLPNRYFIRKVLEEGTLTTSALAVRLSDKRYAEFSAAFGFGDLSTPRNKISDFADTLLARWRDRRFEAAVGEQDGDLRLALAAQRDLAQLAQKSGSERALWFGVLGNPPLRKVMQVALGLPSSSVRLDLDRQVQLFQDRAEAVFGARSVRHFADAQSRERLLQRFVSLSPTEAAGAAPSSPALEVLQTARLSRRI